MIFSIKQKLMYITGGLLLMYAFNLVLALYFIGYIKDEFAHFKSSAYKGEVYTLNINNYIKRSLSGREFPGTQDCRHEFEAFQEGW